MAETRYTVLLKNEITSVIEGKEIPSIGLTALQDGGRLEGGRGLKNDHVVYQKLKN